MGKSTRTSARWGTSRRLEPARAATVGRARRSAQSETGSRGCTHSRPPVRCSLSFATVSIGTVTSSDGFSPRNQASSKNRSTRARPVVTTSLAPVVHTFVVDAEAASGDRAARSGPDPVGDLDAGAAEVLLAALVDEGLFMHHVAPLIGAARQHQASHEGQHANGSVGPRSLREELCLVVTLVAAHYGCSSTWNVK